ncbi:transglycosylase-like protein with SLT domain [Acinetobacter sp. BIGb0102]|nr:transglycosylase-like protein with SLT domain [Acinetobacter sp. BIGb0102]
MQIVSTSSNQGIASNALGSIFLKLSLIVIAVSLSACSSLSGSFANRSNQLSSGLQNAYSVSPNTANRLSPMIIQSAERYDVSPTLLAALIRQESNYNSAARSPTGAIGLTQIISSHWRQSCPGDLYDENVNINCGAHVLSTYYRSAGSWSKAVAYYNVGPTGYQRSFWTRHKGKKYARSVKHHEKTLKKAL